MSAKRHAAEESSPVANRMIEAAFDFLDAGLDNTTLFDEIPDGALLVLIPEVDPEVARRNVALGQRAVQAGRNVYFMHKRNTETRYHITVDLRDERWGSDPQDELGGKTAAEMRQIFTEAVRQAQQHTPIGMQYGNIIVFGGVRMRVLEEPEPGLYRTMAVGRAALGT